MKLAVLGKDLRFAAGLIRRRPFDVMFQVTNRCNMTCSFCDFWPHPAPRHEELTVEEFHRLALELRQLGCFLVSIEGGEPLVRKDLPQIVKAFSKDHLPLLYTNGWFVTPENAQELFAAGLHTASVSIDYPDAARHDAKRGLEGATQRAWNAVELFKAAAPRGGGQVNVMTVYMESNWQDLEALLQQSAARGVGHQVTLLATNGFRRSAGGQDALPPPGAGKLAHQLWKKYPHVRFFGDYFLQMDAFRTQGPMPTCTAGQQNFNVDHVGNVSPCIERIQETVGNVRQTSLAELHGRLQARSKELSTCQQCWTACRGLAQAMGNGGSLQSWRDLALRTRTDG